MKRFTLLVLASAVFLTACQQTPTSSSDSSTKASTTGANASTIDWNQAGPDAKKHEITFETVKREVEAGDAIFYDVRTEEEYKAQNFGITENYPISDLEQGKLPNIAQDTKIYVHCLKGIRSAQATKILRDAGFTNVYDMGGVEHVQAIGGVLK